jgi:very-short-patch-repair endonuclease
MHDTPSTDPSSRRPATTRQARILRHRATLTERTLWTLLRDRRLDGLKFRRQVPIGPYVLDFVCLAHRLVIEADGPFHDDAHDAQRDRWLAAQGFRVLRFRNSDILADRDTVLEKVRESLLPSRVKVAAKPTDEGRPRHPSPRPGPAPNPSSELLRSPPSPARGEGRGAGVPARPGVHGVACLRSVAPVPSPLAGEGGGEADG